MKYAGIVFILGMLSALTMQGLINTSGMETTVDAFMFNFTIQGQDIGESFETFSRDFFPNHTNSTFFGALYLAGYNIMEEIIKFGFFVLAILLLKPMTTRRVLFTGMLIGAGFATVEHFSTETLSWYIFPLRLAGHMLFTTVIALWYSLGSFARMRWIDDGAQGGLVSFFLSKWPQGIMFLWVVAGIFLAAFFHSFVNLYASSGHYMAVVIEAIGWIGVMFFFLNQKSERPYGRIMQEIKLMQDIHDIQETLINLQHPISGNIDTQKEPQSHFEIKKMRLGRNQVAKK